MSDSEILRIGLLLETDKLVKEDYLALKQMVEDQPVELTTIAINAHKYREGDSGETGPGTGPGRVRRFVDHLLNDRPFVLVSLDYVLWKKLGDSGISELEEWSRLFPVADIVEELDQKAVIYEPEPIHDGTGYEVPDHVVDAFAESTDLVVNFEHWILKGRILDAIDHGVLSFHAGDVRRYRGRPACIWQYLNGEPEVGHTLQRLTAELDGGKPIVIRHADIEPTDTIWDLYCKSKQLAPPMLSEGIEKIREEEFEPEEPSELGRLTHSSDKQSWSVVLRIIGKHLLARLRRAM